LGKTAAKAAHEQVRAHERRRGERHERDKGREREDQDGDHGELRDEQKKEHGPEDDDAGDPFDPVAHAIERPAARALSVTRALRRTAIEAVLNAKFEMVSDGPFDATGAADRPDRAALESAFEPPQPATAPAVAASTTIDAVR
jgi:hypothetical protein